MTTTAAAPTQTIDLGPDRPKLLIRESHEVPVATADIWVNTGSADEPRAISGISHFLEHMLFKGTDRFKTGQIEREIENAGGVCNAGTSYDFTHYYVTLPAERIGRAIEMLSEMLGHSTLDAAELEKERLVILEEYRRKQDNPGAMLYEDVYAELYERGPYHLPVIGTEETIKSITREQMADYYRRRYAPQNAALVVTGDVDPERVAELARKHFAGIDKTLDASMRHEEPTAIARAKRVHREKPTGGEVYFALACGAPGFDQMDKVAPLDVAQFILGQGRASILYQEIKEKARLASTIAVYFSAHRRDGVFMASATCDPERREPLAAALRERLRRFAEEPIDPGQLERARRLIGSSNLFAFETTSGASSEVGYYYTMTGGTEFIDRYAERLAAVTAGSVQSAFREMLAANEFIEVDVGPQKPQA